MATTAKLVLPIIAVLALLLFGIHLGDVHRDWVLGFERDYLGMETEPVVAAKPEPALAAAPIAQVRPDPPMPKAEATQPVAPPVLVPLGPAAEARPELAAAPEIAPTPTQPSANLEPAPAPSVGLSLEQNLKLPITVYVKVLIDPDFVATQPEWIEKVKQTIGEASRIFRDNFGIELSLIAMARWPSATTGRDAGALFADLGARQREGADVLLGFVNRELGADAYRLGNAAASGFNGSLGLVGRSAGDDQPFLTGVLRSVGHMLGATEVSDVSSEAYQLGSWMSGAPASTARTHWIDPENRRRILERKTRPFATDAQRPMQ